MIYKDYNLQGLFKELLNIKDSDSSHKKALPKDTEKANKEKGSAEKTDTEKGAAKEPKPQKTQISEIIKKRLTTIQTVEFVHPEKKSSEST